MLLYPNQFSVNKASGCQIPYRASGNRFNFRNLQQASAASNILELWMHSISIQAMDVSHRLAPEDGSGLARQGGFWGLRTPRATNR